MERLERNHRLMVAAGIFERGAGDRVLNWFAEGRQIVDDLAAAIHGDTDPRALNEPQVREWQAEGRELERLVTPTLELHDRLLAEAAEGLDLDFLDAEDEHRQATPPPSPNDDRDGRHLAGLGPMRGGSRRAALNLHDRADAFLHDVTAPSGPVTEAVMQVLDGMGDYDEDAGEVITDAAKSVWMFSIMRGYTLRMASDKPLEIEMPDDDPTDCAVLLLNNAFEDDWFYAHAFPQGSKVWGRLSGAFAQVANAMLLDEQPNGPVFPDEVIDQAVRIGYIACCVDEYFQLRPVYRD